VPYKEVFGKIHDLVVKTVISIEPVVVGNMRVASKYPGVCFELYGFDVLID
jgi:hypothetical protein